MFVYIFSWKSTSLPLEKMSSLICWHWWNHIMIGFPFKGILIFNLIKIWGNATFTSIDNGISKTLKSCTLWIKKATITPSLVAKLKRAGLVNFRDVGSLAGINEERGAQWYWNLTGSHPSPSFRWVSTPSVDTQCWHLPKWYPLWLVWFPNPLAAGSGLGERRGQNALFFLWCTSYLLINQR